MEAFVSLVTNDSYAMGAIALGRSLRNSGTLRKLALLITRQVSMEMRHRLSRLWDELVLVEELDSGDAEHLSLLTRPELGVTFSKLHAWRLTQYRKCVFLDADTIVLQNVDELFDREELSAAPDIGWPDCFNSGVFVFEPSLETFSNLLDLARQRGSFDGGDQGLLNTYWSDWATKDIKYHLPFIYNVTPNITYGYAPAFQQFGGNIKIIHFIGPTKPWQHRYLCELDTVILSPGTYSSEHASQDFITRWWQLYAQEEQRSFQSCDWLSPSWFAPPSTPSHYSLSLSTPSHYSLSLSTPSHSTPTPSQHTPQITLPPPHIVTHTQHLSPGVPVYHVSKYTPYLTPLPPYRSPHVIHATKSPDHDSTSDATPPTKTTPFTPLLFVPSHTEHHSHTSLSFYSQDYLSDKKTPSTVLVGARTPQSDFDYSYDDLEEFNASIYRRLNSIALDDDIVPTLRLSYPYSTDIFVGPPTSVHSSQGIRYPPSVSQSDYSFVPPSTSPHSDPNTSTEGDAYSLPEDTSEHVVSCTSLPLSEGEEEAGRIDMSDSVLTNVTSLSPSTHAHPTPSTTLTPLTRVGKESSEKERSSQAVHLPERVDKSVEQAEFEEGKLDINGRDSFENIQKHIEKMLGSS